jgi:hypothetical protein
MDRLPTWTGQRYQHYPTLPLPCLSPAAAGHGRSNSTNRSKAQSPCIPRTGLRRPLYVGSPKESSDAAPSLRTAVASGEIDVKAHQILAHRMSRTPRRIPPSEQEMRWLSFCICQNHLVIMLKRRGCGGSVSASARITSCATGVSCSRTISIGASSSMISSGMAAGVGVGVGGATGPCRHQHSLPCG